MDKVLCKWKWNKIMRWCNGGNNGLRKEVERKEWKLGTVWDRVKREDYEVMGVK